MFSGNWIGWLVVDPLSGAMWNLTSSEIDATLKKNEDGNSTAASPQVMNILPERKKYCPLAAGLLGILPGGGYYYQSEWGKGLATTFSSAIVSGLFRFRVQSGKSITMVLGLSRGLVINKCFYNYRQCSNGDEERGRVT